jgi:hypothetical protein
MQPVTLRSLAANAYRTLGLSASAGQAAIDAAARRMRIWPDPSRIPPTPWDLPRLGPLSRSRNDIEQAVARLHDPASRAEQRLLWYARATPPADLADDDADDQIESDPPGASASPADHHDAALASLHSALLNDPEVADAARWRRVMERFADLAASPDYAVWLARAEGEGDFEKRASAEEIRAALDAPPSALAAGVAPKARAALDRGDGEACAAIVSLLRAASPAQAGGGPVRALLDDLEDGLHAQCRECDRALRDVLRTNRDAPQDFYSTNFDAAVAAEKAYATRISPALELLCRVSADDPDRTVRARSRCAELLQLVALGWEWSGQPISAERTLLEALELAEGSPFEAAIQRDLERVRPLADQQRAKLPARRIPQRPEGWRPPAPKRPRVLTGPPPASRSRSGLTWALVAIGFAAFIRGLVSSSNNNPRPNNQPTWVHPPYEELAEIRRRAGAMTRPYTRPTGAPWEHVFVPVPAPIPRPPPTSAAAAPPREAPPREAPPGEAPPRPGRVPDAFGETSREP